MGEGYIGKLESLYLVVLHKVIVNIDSFIELLKRNMLVGLVGLVVFAGPKDNHGQAGLNEHGGVGEEVDALAYQLAPAALSKSSMIWCLDGQATGASTLPM